MFHRPLAKNVGITWSRRIAVTRRRGRIGGTGESRISSIVFRKRTAKEKEIKRASFHSPNNIVDRYRLLRSHFTTAAMSPYRFNGRSGRQCAGVMGGGGRSRGDVAGLPYFLSRRDTHHDRGNGGRQQVQVREGGANEAVGTFVTSLPLLQPLSASDNDECDVKIDRREEGGGNKDDRAEGGGRRRPFGRMWP